MMDVTITLPDHVAAAIGDPDTAVGIALAAITEEARRLAVNAVVDQVQAAATAAGAAFDLGVAPPEVPTLAERLAEVDQREADLRAKVRDVGVTLAVAAGVPQEQAAALIESTLAGE